MAWIGQSSSFNNSASSYSYQIKKNDNHKKKIQKNFDYFTLPPRMSIPQFPIPKDLSAVVMNKLVPFHGMTEKSKQYLLVLRKIKQVENYETDQNNHLQILKMMLYLEEIQNNLDMRRYDINNQKITRVGKVSNFFKIYVEGLMEDRPSVRPNDLVEVRDALTRALYLLTVTNVMNDHLIAVSTDKFRQEYNADRLYNTRFRFQNYPLRCCHFSITLIHMYNLISNLFPSKLPACNKQNSDWHWFNKSIENNPEQKQAVLNIVSKSSYPAPYILYGPPGTGKTATLVEAICQIWQNHPSEHVLVCTPSNAAADVITKRLLLNNIPENNLYRMYSPSKEGSQIDEDIIGCSNYVQGQIMMLPKELVAGKNIVICTLVACTRLLAMEFKEKHFAYIFIDEAGQATEPEALIPFNLLSSQREGRLGRLHGQIIIAGDPQQLGPGVRSKIAEPILGKSMLERLMKCEPYMKNEHNKYNPSYITKLLKNYRSHPKIIQVSNELFYENELDACGDENINKAENWRHLVNLKFPVIFCGVEGEEIRDFKSPSVYNPQEITVVKRYVKFLMEEGFNNKRVNQSDIGIVTPFTAQRLKLHNVLNELGYHDIDVGTVELFQGQEKDIIILSTVRNKIFYHDERLHIGFLSNQKRFNVALTRAKALLIVIGNPSVLQTDKYWSYFLNFCKRNRACCGVDFQMQDHFENQLERSNISNHQNKSSLITGDDLKNIEIDDGVPDDADNVQTIETEFRVLSIKAENKSSNETVANNNKMAEQSLSNVAVIKTEDQIKQEKAAAKKAKKQKKKNAS